MKFHTIKHTQGTLILDLEKIIAIDTICSTEYDIKINIVTASGYYYLLFESKAIRDAVLELISLSLAKLNETSNS